MWGGLPFSRAQERPREKQLTGRAPKRARLRLPLPRPESRKKAHFPGSGRAEEEDALPGPADALMGFEPKDAYREKEGLKNAAWDRKKGPGAGAEAGQTGQDSSNARGERAADLEVLWHPQREHDGLLQEPLGIGEACDGIPPHARGGLQDLARELVRGGGERETGDRDERAKRADSLNFISSLPGRAKRRGFRQAPLRACSARSGSGPSYLSAGFPPAPPSAAFAPPPPPAPLATLFVWEGARDGGAM